MFYRYFPFWKAFFEALGWEVVLSGGVEKKGKIIYFEDSCLPMKLLVTHASNLANQVDHLFVPRLISLHRKYILCPKFRAAPDIIRLALEKKVSILDETIDFRTKKHSLRMAFSKLGEKLGSPSKTVRAAFSKAEQLFSVFQKEWIDRINELPTKDLYDLDVPTPLHKVSPPLAGGDSGEGAIEGGGWSMGFPENKEAPLRVAFIGHPYNLFDIDINKDILGLAKRLGMKIVTSDLLSEEIMEREISHLSKEIYWSSGREIVGSLFHFLSEGVDGVVFVTSFKCGIDALLQEFAKRMMRIRGGSSAPFLALSFDEHTGREGLTTRLEAFRDVMEERKNQALNSKHPIPS